MSATVRVSVQATEGVEARGRLVAEDLDALDGAPLDAESCRRRRFSGKVGEALATTTPDGALEVLLGVGPRTEVGRNALRRAGAALVRAAPGCRILSCALACGDLLDMALAAQSVAEGAVLATYRFTSYRPAADAPALEELVVLVPGAQEQDAAAGAVRGVVIAEAVMCARDLVNTPAGDLTPTSFAERARSVAQSAGLELTVIDAEAARREGLGGLLGVGAGSSTPPLLLRLAYRPPGAETTVALVGKGITFDSGGLSLKPPTSMMAMKTDMSGAAAVLATLGACRRLAVPCAVVGFMALAENMPGGSATKPGDVLRIRNGKTIEVLNTDAEGRLVLADALSLAVEEQPDAIIDLATLTGACVVALGRQMAGLFSNDARLLSAVREAGVQAGEPAWPLPLPNAYRAQVDSEIADMKNIGAAGEAGAVIAALILQEFVGTVPWAHLDIAGPARSEEANGLLQKGGTGFGVRLLCELLAAYRPIGGMAMPDPIATVRLA